MSLLLLLKGAAGGNVTVTPGVASLTLTTFAPVIQLGVVPGVTALTLTTFAPVVKLAVIPGTATLTLTTFAPTVTATQNQTVTPPVAALTLTTFAPVVQLGVIPGVASLTLTTFAPVIKLTVIPGVAALTLTTFAPTVTATANQTVTPGVVALVLTTFAPTVTGGSGVTVIPGTATLTLTTFAPTVTSSGTGVTFVASVTFDLGGRYGVGRVEANVPFTVPAAVADVFEAEYKPVPQAKRIMNWHLENADPGDAPTDPSLYAAWWTAFNLRRAEFISGVSHPEPDDGLIDGLTRQ